MNNPTEPDDTRDPAPAQPEPAPATVELTHLDESVPATHEPAMPGPAQAPETSYAETPYAENPYAEAPYAETPYVETPYAASPYPQAPPPKRRSRLFYIVAGVIGTVLVVGLLCGGAVGFGVFHAWQTSFVVAPVIEATMQAMEDKDVDKAFTLFVKPIQGEALRDNLNQMIENPEFYAYFEGYEKLNIQGINAGVNAGTTANGLSGEYARVTADVVYADGTHRVLTAVLNKVDGEWRMYDVQIGKPTKPDGTPAPTPLEGA